MKNLLHPRWQLLWQFLLQPVAVLAPLRLPALLNPRPNLRQHRLKPLRRKLLATSWYAGSLVVW